MPYKKQSALHSAFYFIKAVKDEESNDFFAELFAAEEMEVKMLYGLCAILPDVCDNSVTVLKSELCGNLGNSGENCRNIVCVILVDSISRVDMRLGNDQAMNGGLGIDIVEGVAMLILIYLF